MNLPELITKLLIIERQLIEEGIEVNTVEVDISLLNKTIIDMYYYSNWNKILLVHKDN